jgi:hypothetical protein
MQNKHPHIFLHVFLYTHSQHPSSLASGIILYYTQLFLFFSEL